MTAWRGVLQKVGVEVHESTEVHGFVWQAQTASAVETSRGPLTANWFVLATGPWTPQLNRWLGMKVPTQSGKGNSMTMLRRSLETCVGCCEKPTRTVSLTRTQLFSLSLPYFLASAPS